MAWPPWPLWIGIAVMITAAMVSYRTLIIPNWLTFPSMGVGVAFALLFGDRTGGDVVSSLVGIGGSLATLLPLYRHGLGAGSVKTQMAFGAWVGSAYPSEGSFAITMLVGIVGSLVTYCTGWVIAKRRLSREEHPSELAHPQPYLFAAQIPLTLGSLLAVVLCIWLKSLKII